MIAAAAPIRTCVGCRQRAPKAELVRLVRHPDGRVFLDPQGRGPGRGAYLHRAEKCLRRGIRSGSLGRALRASLAEAEVSRLIEEFERGMGEES